MAQANPAHKGHAVRVLFAVPVALPTMSAAATLPQPWYDRLRPKTSVPTSWRKDVLCIPYYAPSCFSYTVLGLVVAVFREELTTMLPSLVPWNWIALTCALQGPNSYMADVHSLARDSWWHAADTIVASFLMAFYAEVMAFGFAHGSWRGLLQLLVGGWAYAAGIAAFLKSRDARRGPQRSPADYAYWHSLWHVAIPI